MESERERLKPFLRALSKEIQEVFDCLFDGAKMHTSTGVYMANPRPMENILLSICLEHGKLIEEILGGVVSGDIVKPSICLAPRPLKRCL